ncbi:MAG: ASKHA domain-containing protein [Oscillospiraceae bacterium]|nr:ASKHA domain-containing protein [Oscillospiraceae bacterium]
MRVTFEPQGVCVSVTAGTTLLQAQITAGLRPDAPCGGKGTCGKCRAVLDGQEILTCQTAVDRDMTVTLPGGRQEAVLTVGTAVSVRPDGTDRYVLALDVGTTTLAAYLLDGRTGTLLASASALNPQRQYGADVISRIQYTLEHGGDALQNCVREALVSLTERMTEEAGISPFEITAAAAAGNTAMHHLLLGIAPDSLVTPPYMPQVSEALEAEGLLPISGKIRMLPNIAGFVGGDTAACMTAVRFGELEELTLLIDIGTNGEMVLGNRERRIACSTAAGPAFEGAKISCGMRGAEGAVDHVTLKNGEIVYHVIGGGKAVGLCGSGLLDLTAVLLETGHIDESGFLEGGEYCLNGSAVTLTQQDVRETQLAKAAIRAGIELLAQKLGRTVGEIQTVYLAGAFGNYLNPASACRIGMLPPCLEGRIVPIGNAAGEGAKLCALSREAYLYSQTLARDTEFLELASLPQFQDCYVDALLFSEDEDDLV